MALWEISIGWTRKALVVGSPEARPKSQKLFLILILFPFSKVIRTLSVCS